MKIGNRYVMLLVSLVLFLVACRQTLFEFGHPTPTTIPVDLQDWSWLVGNPCSPPCWYGLVPDVSKEEEVIDVLTSLPFVYHEEIEIDVIGQHDALTGESIDAKQIRINKINDKSIRAVIGDGVLKIIEFGLNFDITITEVVDYLGTPDLIRMVPDFNNNYCEVEFYWLDTQLISISKIIGNGWKEKCMQIESGGPVDRNMLISRISIIYQNWIIAMMERNSASPWPGFTDE